MDGAAELFEERGYAETSVGEIAERVGISKPTLYHYFLSKEEVLYEIHETFTRRILERHGRDRAESDDPVELLHRLCRSFFLVMREDRAHVRTFFSYFGELSGQYRAAILERRRQLSELIEGLIAVGVSVGAFRDVDPRLAMLLLTGVFNWAPNWYRPDGPLSPEELADFVFDVFVRGVEA